MIQRTWFPRINRNSPLARGLLCAGLGGGASSSLFVDSSLYGNHCTLVNSPVLVFDSSIGRFALEFNGSTNTYIQTPTLSLTGGAAGSFTFACWVNASATNSTYRCIWRPDSIANFGVYHWNNNTIVYYSPRLGGYANLIATPVVGRWHHVAIVSDPATSAATAFWDGVPIANDPTNWVMGELAASAFKIGSDAWNQTFCGRMSDLIVSSQVFSPSQIQQLADPSNVMLSGLILPPVRKIWPVATVAGSTSISWTTAATYHPMQFMVC